MPRRHQLTYDVGEAPARRPLPLGPLLVLVAVVLVAVLLVVGMVGRQSPQATPAVSVTPSVTPSASPPSSSPLPSGTDADEGLGTPEGSQRAAALFVRAWLNPNRRTRKSGLAVVSAPGLTEELMLTDPANIPRAKPRGAPVLGEADAYSAQFTQTLSSGMRIDVYLVADPEARYKWVATSVEQA